MNKTEVLYGKHQDPERKEHWSLFFLKNREMVSNKIWFMLVWEVPFVRVTLKVEFFWPCWWWFFLWLNLLCILFFGLLVASIYAKEAIQGHKTKNPAGKSTWECQEGPKDISWAFTWGNKSTTAHTILSVFKLLCWYSFSQDLQANLESLPPHVPSYLKVAVGPPSSTSRRHFCTVCGYAATYTCVKCGMRFCSCRCQNIHNDTRCQKFVA